MQSMPVARSEDLPFVAKVFQTRTRKGKDYFVYRFNMPKEVGENMALRDGDYVFFRAMPAQWYHMLDWKEMARTYAMLPVDMKEKVIESGLVRQSMWRSIAVSTSGVAMTAQLGANTGSATNSFVGGEISR